MAAAASELLAHALAFSLEGHAGGRDPVDELVEIADCSPTVLMGAYALALTLARDMPYDTSNERTLGLLTQALQRAVRLSGERGSPDGSASLLRHIVEVAGQSALAPGAVASREAEVEADVGHLWAHDTVEDEPTPP